MRKRFRWTRKAYREAHWMARFIGRHLYDLPSHQPNLLRRYYELWDRYPQRDDPLLRLVRCRLTEKQRAADTETPF